MFEQPFKNIDDILWKDAGGSTELDYAEQSSWILFLKWLDDYEKDKQTKAKLDNKKFKLVLDKEFQWSSWAVVKKKDGKVDFNKTLTGPDLKKFVDKKYGVANINAIHHYEDADGYEVDSTAAGATSVTNYIHEETLNDAKRNLTIIRSEYVSNVVNEFKKLLK